MGERFGGYEIEEKLGEGGMAEVFSAIRRGEDGFVRRVCIKKMLREQEGDPAMVELFGDEARIMAGLHHPAIVSVLELGKHAGRSFLAMELVDGVDLRKVLRRTGPLAADLAVLVAQVGFGAALQLCYQRSELLPLPGTAGQRDGQMGCA